MSSLVEVFLPTSKSNWIWDCKRAPDWDKQMPAFLFIQALCQKFHSNVQNLCKSFAQKLLLIITTFIACTRNVGSSWDGPMQLLLCVSYWCWLILHAILLVCLFCLFISFFLVSLHVCCISVLVYLCVFCQVRQWEHWFYLHLFLFHPFLFLCLFVASVCLSIVFVCLFIVHSKSVRAWILFASLQIPPFSNSSWQLCITMFKLDFAHFCMTWCCNIENVDEILPFHKYAPDLQKTTAYVLKNMDRKVNVFISLTLERMVQNVW